jgi:hypothetical protein
VDESLCSQGEFALRVSLLGLGQNPEVIYLFPIKHDLPIYIGPFCVCLPDAVSSPQFIGFIKQAQLVKLLITERSLRIVVSVRSSPLDQRRVSKLEVSTCF